MGSAFVNSGGVDSGPIAQYLKKCLLLSIVRLVLVMTAGYSDSAITMGLFLLLSLKNRTLLLGSVRDLSRERWASGKV